jgi:hypothetical protein
MDFFINMGFIDSDSPFINNAKMIYQLPYLYICINGRGLYYGAAFWRSCVFVIRHTRSLREQ